VSLFVAVPKVQTWRFAGEVPQNQNVRLRESESDERLEASDVEDLLEERSAETTMRASYPRNPRIFFNT